MFVASPTPHRPDATDAFQRCWEKMKCGREPGGRNERLFGPCRVPTFREAACWLIAGADQGQDRQCLYVMQGNDCSACKTYLAFHEAVRFQLSRSGDEIDDREAVGVAWTEAL